MAGEQDVFAGQPLIFSAGLYNDLLEMRREWRNTRHEKPVTPGTSVSRSDIVQVKNGSEVNILRGEVLGFTTYMLTGLTASHFWFNGDEYTDEVGWGISRQPIRIGKIGDCQIAGACVAWVNVTDALHEYAAPASAQRYLQSTPWGGARIIYKESGTGNKECIVQLSPEWRGILGKTDSTHAKGASGTVSIWSGAPGSESDTTVNVTAYNRFAAIGTGKWVWLDHNGSGYYITAAEC